MFFDIFNTQEKEKKMGEIFFSGKVFFLKKHCSYRNLRFVWNDLKTYTIFIKKSCRTIPLVFPISFMTFVILDQTRTKGQKLFSTRKLAILRKIVFSILFNLLQKWVWNLHNDCHGTLWSLINIYMSCAILSVSRKNCFSVRKNPFFQLCIFRRLDPKDTILLIP